MKNTYRNHLHEKLCKLFLYTVFATPLGIRKEIVKHLEIPEDNLQLGNPVETEEATQIPASIVFEDNKEEFVLIFSKRIDPPKEVDVPKIVKEKRKWWQVGEGDSKLIVEKQKTKERPYWVLTSIK